MKISLVLGAVWLAQSAVCLGFKAQIVNVPEDALDLENFKAGKTLPIDRNYPSRVDVKVVGLGSKRDENHEFLVKKLYEFDVDELTAGEYELLVHSHDFHIRQTRFRVSVKDDEIVVSEDPLGVSSKNKTTNWTVSESKPLILEAQGIKVYEESPRNKLKEMVMQSPLGFIFRNKTYTILFFACMGLMITPTLVQWLNPGLADQFTEMQQEAYEKRAQRLRAEKEAEAKAAAITEKLTKKSKKRN